MVGDDGHVPEPRVHSWDTGCSTELTLEQDATQQLDVSSTGFLICLAGILVSSFAVFFQSAVCAPSFAVLWLGYLGLLHVGQTFLTFQWDILLLETGFICILLAPRERFADQF